MPFSAMTSSVANCGAISYTIGTIDNTVYTIDGTNSNVLAQPTDKTVWVGDHTFTVTGTLDSYNTKTATSNTVTVTIVNPCSTTTVVSKAVNAMTTTVLVSKAQTFTDFTDAASVLYGAGTCGTFTYSIKMSDGTTAVPAYLTLAT